MESDYFARHPNKKGVTTANSDGDIVIAFNKSLCDKGPLLQALTIFHEGRHADLWKHIIDNLPEGESIINLSESTYEETINSLFNLACSNNSLSDQYEEFLKSYIDDIAKALHKINGNYGNWKDYKYVAYLGSWNENSECATDILSISEFNILKKNYNNNIKNNITIDLSQCPE